MFKNILNYFTNLNPFKKSIPVKQEDTGDVFFCIGCKSLKTDKGQPDLSASVEKFTPILNALKSQNYLTYRSTLQGFEDDYYFVVVNLTYVDLGGIPIGLTIERLEGQLGEAYTVTALAQLRGGGCYKEFKGKLSDKDLVSKLLYQIRQYK